MFVERKAWAPQIGRLWERVGKDCEWELPKAPAVRILWDVRAVDAVVEFLEWFGTEKRPCKSPPLPVRAAASRCHSPSGRM